MLWVWEHNLDSAGQYVPIQPRKYEVEIYAQLGGDVLLVFVLNQI